jgi:hypothetical protein
MLRKEILLQRAIYSSAAYKATIVHFIIGLIMISAVSIISVMTDTEKLLHCLVAYGTCKTVACRNVDRTCYFQYQQTYNLPMPLYIFVILSILFPINVAFIYSLWMRCRGEIRSSNRPLTEDQTQNKEIYLGSYCYFFHLVIRFLSGILFTILQHTVFFPSGFESTFSCSLPPTYFTSQIAKNASASQSNVQFTCHNLAASSNETLSIGLSILNSFFSLQMLMEIIYLCRRSSKFNRAAALCFLFYLVIGSLLYLLIHLKTLIT